mgnify:CR=1 FL=1
MKHRRNALYHQQAIQEALITGLDFMKIPNTTALVTALQSKDKARIKAASDSLQIAADKYFASVPFPEVERIVGKKMLQTYMKYIPAEQRIGIFKVIDKRFKVIVMPLSMPASNILSSAARKTLPSLSVNLVCISSVTTG